MVLTNYNIPGNYKHQHIAFTIAGADLSCSPAAHRCKQVLGTSSISSVLHLGFHFEVAIGDLWFLGDGWQDSDKIES